MTVLGTKRYRSRPSNASHRVWAALTVLAGLVVAGGVGLGLRLGAEERKEAPDPDGPPEVSVSLSHATLLPEDFPRDDVEACGRLLNVWNEGTTRVLQYRGEFRLDFERRRLSADNAVLWITPEQVEGGTLKRFVVYLDGHARVVDLGGTTTTDSKLCVSFASTGRVWTYSDVSSEVNAADSDLYQRVRAAKRESQPVPLPQLKAGEAASRQVAPGRDQAPAVSPAVLMRTEGPVVQVRGDERVVVCPRTLVLTQAWARDLGESRGELTIRADRGVVFAQEAAATSQPAGAGPASLGQRITGAYLEGDVVLTWGERTIEGNRLYYDFENDRALFLDAVVTIRHPSRQVPLIVWADQLRQLSRTESVAYGAQVTTSEMKTPQFAIGAKELYLRDESAHATEEASRGKEAEVKVRRTAYTIKDETVKVRGVPVFYWPQSKGELGTQETALRTVRVGTESDFGPYIRAQWYLFKLLNMEPPEGFKNTYLDTDYYGTRGPAAALTSKYGRDDFFGFFNAFYVHDFEQQDQKKENTQDQTGERIPTSRGRVLWRHHHYLPRDWELLAEFSFMSDRDFLKEWFKPEYDTGKEQETSLYAKKTWGQNAFTALATVRLNDFLNQTEKLPEVKYYKIGQPLLNDRLVFFSENSIAALNYAVDKERTDLADSGWGARGDTRQEVQWPLSAGPVQVVPYAAVRGTFWSKKMSGEIPANPDLGGDSTDERDEHGGGGNVRLFGDVGVHASTWFSRTFNQVESRFWDVHRLRHLIKPEVTVHGAVAGVERDELYPFDPGVESITGASAVNLSLRQILQTKRGGPDNWRNVDWMILDLEGTVFSQEDEQSNFEPQFTRPRSTRTIEDRLARGEFFEPRPENSLARSTFNWYYEWRISDTMTLLSDGNIGSGGLDRESIGLAVQRSPRWSVYVGQRHVSLLDSNQLILSTHYKINRKHDTSLTVNWDTTENRLASAQWTLVRKFQRWYAALTFDMAATGADDKTRQMVGLMIWPEGAPEIRLGTGHFSRYGTTTSSKNPN